MTTNVYDEAVAAFHREVDSKLQQSASLDVQIQGKIQHLDALSRQEREMIASNRELADQVAASRKEIADAPSKAKEIEDQGRRSRDDADSAHRRELESRKADFRVRLRAAVVDAIDDCIAKSFG
jgi:chromosome segregation ATPase